LGERCDELVGAIRLERARRIVQQHSRGAELRQPLRLLDELLRLAALAGAVDETGVELALCGHERPARLAQGRAVVQRILEPEDIDPALGRAGDEAAREVVADGPRPDEEATAERHRERRLRPRLERANPLPWALDPAPHCRVEDASAGDLEVREA